MKERKISLALCAPCDARCLLDWQSKTEKAHSKKNCIHIYENENRAERSWVWAKKRPRKLCVREFLLFYKFMLVVLGKKKLVFAASIQDFFALFCCIDWMGMSRWEEFLDFKPKKLVKFYMLLF